MIKKIKLFQKLQKPDNLKSTKGSRKSKVPKEQPPKDPNIFI